MEKCVGHTLSAKKLFWMKIAQWFIRVSLLCIDVAYDSHNNDILHIMNVYNWIKNIILCVW